MEQLRDVIAHLLSLAGPSGIGRTALNKLVYFCELESWSRRGEPLTTVSFYRFHYGAWAPDVRAVAEDLPYVEHNRLLFFYPENRYKLKDNAPQPPLSDDALAILTDIWQRYGRMTAASIGAVSKQTVPMQTARGEGETLDLSVVAPARPRLRVRNSALAQAQRELDTSRRGTRQELDERDRVELAAWAPARKRAAADS